MAAKLQCEICGGKLIGKPGGIFECDSCGMEYSTAWAKEKIQEITGTVKVEGTVEVTGKVQVDGPIQVDRSASKEALLQRGNLALEDGEWEKAKEFFDKVLDGDATCAEAYLGLTMAEEEYQDKEAFHRAYVDPDSKCKSNKRLTRVRQFGDAKLLSWFENLDAELEEQLKEKQQMELKAAERLKILREKQKSARVMIAATSFHTVGLCSDGKVVAVGNNDDGKSEVSGWQDIVAVSAGDLHTVGLKADGTVVAVGTNSNGQCEVSSWTDIVAVAAGNYHTVGLRSDGTVVATEYTGDQVFNRGQCEVSDWMGIVAVVAGDLQTIGVRADGTVVTVGFNKWNTPKFSSWEDIVAVAAGSHRAVGLRANGTVVAVGANDHGECEVSSWTSIVAVAVGYTHTVGLRADGTVVAVGRNQYGECNVEDWTHIVSIAAGENNTVGLKADGTLVTVGWNNYGKCNVSAWKLYDNFETVEVERKAAIEKAEGNRKVAAEEAETGRKAAAEKAEKDCKMRIAKLQEEKSKLRSELFNIHGLFKGRRCRELQDRIDAIEEELERLK